MHFFVRLSYMLPADIWYKDIACVSMILIAHLAYQTIDLPDK